MLGVLQPHRSRVQPGRVFSHLHDGWLIANSLFGKGLLRCAELKGKEGKCFQLISLLTEDWTKQQRKGEALKCVVLIIS